MSISSSSRAHVTFEASGKPVVPLIEPIWKNGLAIEPTDENFLAIGQAGILANPEIRRSDLCHASSVNAFRQPAVCCNRRSVGLDLLDSELRLRIAIIGASHPDQRERSADISFRSPLLLGCFFLDRIRRKGIYNLTNLARFTIAGEALASTAKL